MRSVTLVALGVASLLALAACGTSGTSAPTSTPTTRAASQVKLSNHWVKVATVPPGNTVAAEQPAGNTLLLLLAEPATANHRAGYVGAIASPGEQVQIVTPPFLPPTGLQQAINAHVAWGRLSNGTWWVAEYDLDAFTNDFTGRTPIASAVWIPGDKAWTTVPTPKLSNIASFIYSNGNMSIVSDQDYTPWLVADVYGAGGNSMQTLVYGLTDSGWSQVHAFPLTPSSTSSRELACAGPKGDLLVAPENNGEPVLMSPSGTIEKTYAMPQSIQSAFETVPSCAMSPAGGIYLFNGGDRLWQWKGANAQSLLVSGSTLSQRGVTWQGFWRGEPVVSSTSVGGNITFSVYSAGQWKPAPFLQRPGKGANVFGEKVAFPVQWGQSILWSVGGKGAIYVRRAPSAG